MKKEEYALLFIHNFSSCFLAIVVVVVFLVHSSVFFFCFFFFVFIHARHSIRIRASMSSEHSSEHERRKGVSIKDSKSYKQFLYFAARNEKERRNCFGAPSPSGSLISFRRSIGKRAAKFRPCTHQNKKISFARPKKRRVKTSSVLFERGEKELPCSCIESCVFSHFPLFSFVFFFFLSRERDHVAIYLKLSCAMLTKNILDR